MTMVSDNDKKIIYQELALNHNSITQLVAISQDHASTDLANKQHLSTQYRTLTNLINYLYCDFCYNTILVQRTASTTDKLQYDYNANDLFNELLQTVITAYQAAQNEPAHVLTANLLFTAYFIN